MKRTTWNLLIDFLAAITFAGMIATGYILYFSMPPGTNKTLSLWGLTRHRWGEVHFWMSIGLLAILLTHLALHWQWVVAMVGKQFHVATQAQASHIGGAVITLLAVIGVLGMFAWLTQVSVREIDSEYCPPGETTPAVTPAGVESSPTTKGSQVNLWKDVYPILERSCLRCHGPRKAAGGFRIDRRDDYFGKNGHTPLIIPGKAAESPLIVIVSGRKTDMPLAANHKLPEPEVAVLQNWIAAGAEWPKTRDAR
jgi:mono/diheme cytochrome c family protein